jgi:hypothetical protein
MLPPSRRKALCGLFQRPRGLLSCGRRVVWQRGSRELLNQNLYSCGAESGYKHRQEHQSYGLAPGHIVFLTALCAAAKSTDEPSPASPGSA